jgi:hypothetical protein
MSTFSYVNTTSLNEIYDPLEKTEDLYQRTNSMLKLQDEISSRHINLLAKTCFELKLNGETIIQIADTFNISKLKVQNLIKFWSKKTNSQNPLFKYAVLEYMDMSYLVQTSTFHVEH